MKRKIVVVDTNLLFSSLLPTTSAIRDMLIEAKYHFYAPNYIIGELFRHKEKIVKYTKLDENEFYTYFSLVTESVTFIPLDFISLPNRQKAYDLCNGIDIKDTAFVALALELNAPLWTGDKKLKAGLNERGYQQFFEVSL